MNKYLISLIEIIVLGAIAKFSAKNIDIFTVNDSIVRLNHISGYNNRIKCFN